MEILYFAIIYPRILYGIEVYANTYLTYLHDLMILNNRLLRILQHKKYFTNTIDLYTTYGTLPINILFKYQLLLFAHDIFYKSDKLPEIFHLNRLTNTDIHNYSTRSRQDFHLICQNSVFGSKMSVNLYSKFWNSLPITLKSYSNFKLFKENLKTFLYSNSM